MWGTTDTGSVPHKEATMARTTNKAQTAKTTAKEPKPKVACRCGCGGLTSSTFVPGHDARHKGALIRAIFESGDAKEAEVALAEVRDLSWERFLEARTRAAVQAAAVLPLLQAIGLAR